MNSPDNPATTKQRRSTSFSLIFGALLAGFAAYYFDAGPKLMTYVMYLQEQAKVKSEIKVAGQEKLEGKDPNAPSDVGGFAPFKDPPGYDNSKEPGANPEPSEDPPK